MKQATLEGKEIQEWVESALENKLEGVRMRESLSTINWRKD